VVGWGWGGGEGRRKGRKEGGRGEMKDIQSSNSFQRRCQYTDNPYCKYRYLLCQQHLSMSHNRLSATQTMNNDPSNLPKTTLSSCDSSTGEQLRSRCIT